MTNVSEARYPVLETLILYWVSKLNLAENKIKKKKKKNRLLGL